MAVELTFLRSDICARSKYAGNNFHRTRMYLLIGAAGLVIFLAPSIMARSETLAQYAKTCEQLTKIDVPEFECEKNGIEVPDTHHTGSTCDRPQQLEQICDPGSKFQILRETDEAFTVAHCRKGGQPYGKFNDIAVIQHNKENGYTCFYQALADGLSGHVAPPKMGTAPWFGVDAHSVWLTPAETAVIGCGACHDNGAILRSPYLAQLDALPGAYDPEFNKSGDPYCFAGEDFATWHVYEVRIDGNKCSSCHRMGVSNIPRVKHPGKVFGTSLLFGPRSTQEKPPPSKNPHSKDSPLWMPPDTFKFNVDNWNAANAIANCAKQFHEGQKLPDSASCRITPINLDPCLVGKWEAYEVMYPTTSPTKYADPGMGTGFTVEFRCDGTQIVDYSKMTTIKLPQPAHPELVDKINYTGKATGRIFTYKVKGKWPDSMGEATKNSKVEVKGEVKFTIDTAAFPTPITWNLTGTWGPGGLGVTSGSNSYSCSKDKLIYKGSVHRDWRPNFMITLKRIKE